ncbi:glycosyltransferase family 4 protein [Candidatus Uhrbacteria bacterium]|nr:glycosyltransferase family 4 protein [Candidatus Uhrbacteria bacterium]
MRAFFFITKSEQGGAQTHVAQLTKWLIEHDHEVAVMSAPGGWLHTQTIQLGGRFIPNNHLGNILHIFQLWAASRQFLQSVHEYKPDIVACHSTIAGLIGRFALRGRVPTIFTAHGWGFTQGTPVLRRLFLPLFERIAGRFTSKIICVSGNDLELAKSHRIAPAEKLVQIYNGIEVADSRSLDDDKNLHIFFVGRLAPPKNPFLLVEAFARLDRELQERILVTIIGDGPDREKLERRILAQELAHRIKLTGALPREQVLHRLQTQADVFILLSRWEGFPYSVLEAMSAGIPVIASRVGGIPEALEHGGGILVDENIEQLIHALTTLINKNARIAMGVAAKRSVETHFSIEQMCADTFAQYEQALLQ